MFLKDINCKGQYIDWQEKKKKNLVIAESYKRLEDYKKYELLYKCSDILIYKLYSDNSKKLYKANFCRQRLCNMCNWRKSLKLFSQVSQIMDKIDTFNKNYHYVFLTLTIKNCPGEELSKHIDILIKGYDLFFKRRPLSFILGSFRSLEVTYNKLTNTFHPHLHCILVMPSDYYSRYYVSQKKFSEYWKECIKSEYIPIVHVEKIKNNIKKSVCEATKYAVKDSDIIFENKNIQDYVIDILTKCLSGRRLTSYRGIFFEVKKSLKLEDVEKSDLIVTNDDDIRNDLDYVLSVYKWHYGYSNYVFIENVSKRSY